MANSILREHKHVIVRAYVNNPPMNADKLSEWCTDVISSVGMKCVGGPLLVYSEMEGNRGYTAIAVLDFSHLAIHCWDEVSPALIEFDLFSCLDFDPKIVVEMLDKSYKIQKYDIIIINRDDMDKNMFGNYSEVA